MKQTPKDDLARLFDLARRAPGFGVRSAPPGFAARVARSVNREGDDVMEREVLNVAFRWAVLASVAVTALVCAWSAPSVFNGAFAPDTAFESHISNRALFPWDR